MNSTQPLLSDLFEKAFLPNCCANASDAYITRFRLAIRWFDRALGRPARTSDLTSESLELLVSTLAAANYKRPHIRVLRSSLVRLWKFGNRLGVAPQASPDGIRREHPLHLPLSDANPLRKWRRGQALHLPDPEPGTLRHYFDTVYRPQRLQRGQPTTFAMFRSFFICLWRFLGHDAELGDCRKEHVIALVDWLLNNRGRSPRTANRYCQCWVAVWRHAHKNGHLTELPFEFEKLPTEREAPDAWSVDELARLVQATTTFKTGAIHRGILHADLFRAIILVGYHTAIRKRSLLAIRIEDVDLTAGVITVRGSTIKNRRGRRFLVPAYVINAIRAIWDPRRKRLFPIHAGYADKQIGALIAHAGLPRSPHHLGHFHKLRRTAATQAAVIGGTNAASKLLDHSGEYLTLLYIDQTKLPDVATSMKLPAIGGPL
jgi:site-specific recombinase XerD